MWVSDHVCWTGVGGRNTHELVPIPFTEEALAHVVGVRVVQEYPGAAAGAREPEQLRRRTRSRPCGVGSFSRGWPDGADCGLLLDVKRVVAAVNHDFDPLEYLGRCPHERVVQMHLAGHADEGRYVVDTHDRPVAKRCGTCTRGLRADRRRIDADGVGRGPAAVPGGAGRAA